MITYEDSALEYIAKLSDGGMRNAISLMDKCLAYSDKLTLANVVNALGVVDYSLMFELTTAIFQHNQAKCLEIVDSLHMQGKDLKVFVKSFMEFVLDVNKYTYMQSFDTLMIPSLYDEEMQSYGAVTTDAKQHLLSTLVGLNADVKWDTNPKALIEATLLMECAR